MGSISMIDLPHNLSLFDTRTTSASGDVLRLSEGCDCSSSKVQLGTLAGYFD